MRQCSTLLCAGAVWQFKRSRANIDNARVIKRRLFRTQSSNSRLFRWFDFYKTRIMSMSQALKESRKSTPNKMECRLACNIVAHARCLTPDCGVLSGDVTAVVWSVQCSHFCTPIFTFENDVGPTVWPSPFKWPAIPCNSREKKFLTHTVV